MNMEKTNLENQIIGKAQGGKLDTNLSALADSMQFLSLGVPGISRPKKFNVNAWSTPLKSIENQSRRVAREKIYEIVSTNDVDDDSLSNLSDLFPGQNFFEETSDFIEYYRLNSPEESNCSRVGDRTGSSASAHATCPPNESTVADLSVSNSNSPSNRSRSAKKFSSFSVSSVNLSDDVKSRFSPSHSAEKLEPPMTRLSEQVSTDSTVSPSPLESFELDQLTLVIAEVDRSSRSPHRSSDMSARSVGHATSLVADERRVELLKSSSHSMYEGNGNDVGSGYYPTSPDYEGSSIRKWSDLSDPPIDDENDVSSCDSTTGDDNFYMAVSHIENGSCDSPSSKSGRLDSAEVVGLQWQCGSGAASETEGYVEKGVEPISKCGDEAGVATSTDDKSPCKGKETSIPELDDEYEIDVSSPFAQPSGKLNPEEGANHLSSLSDRFDCSYLPTTSLVSCAPSAICDSHVELQFHSSVSSSRTLYSYSKTVDQTEVSAGAEPSSPAQPAISNRHSNGWTTVVGAETNSDSHRNEQTPCGAFSTVPQMETSNFYDLHISDCDLSGACITTSSNFDGKNCLAQECDRVTPGLSVDSSLDVVGTKSVFDVDCAVCHSSQTSSKVDESGDADDDEEDFVATSSPLTSPLVSKTVCDAVDCTRRVSPDAGGSRDPTPNEKASLSPRTRTTSPDDQTSFLADTLPTEPHRNEAGPTVGYSDHVVSHSENSAVLLSRASAEVAPSIDVFLEHNAMAYASNASLDAAERVSVNADDCFEDCTESQYHLTMEERSKTPRSKYSDNDRSCVADFPDLGDSQIEENERFAEYEVENECDSLEAVSMEKSMNILTFAEKPPSKSDGQPLKLSPTPPFNPHERTSMDVINESVKVCLKTVKFHSAVNVVCTDKPISHQQSEKLNSLLKTPTKHAEQEQNLPSDKLARVCDSMNKLMSLCTPMKDLRTQSRTPINPFRCENVGNESQKIVFDFPTSLLDVSIGMLESMTAMMAPVEPASSVSHLDEHNIASDLITVAQTPKIIHSQPNHTSSSSRLNESNIHKHLLEENDNLKKELEEYKRKYDVLHGEYESILKTAHALRINEATLKKALQEYEDETRKACNKYHILKEYASTLIMSLNRSLDQCEDELKMKNDELQKLKGSL